MKDKAPHALIAPAGPPKLVVMAAKKDALEGARETLFPKWKAALEAAGGCVSRAGAAFFPELDPKAARHKGNRLTRRFKLTEYAASLRIQATGHDRGRQDR